ncbi:hypothetical protein MMC30_000625 [Trapelia coarctata]|nr:hypothetical protein [Trapelia coarctata]
MSGPGLCSTPPDCTGWPDNCSPAPPDADIAGLGIIISFCLSAFITLLLSVLLHFLLPPSPEDLLPPRKPLAIPPSTPAPPTPPIPHASTAAAAALPPTKRSRWARILGKTILGLSDQQLASSLALLTIAFIRHCEIATYHLTLICCLAWFSSVTHLSSVFALRRYWREESNAFALYTRVALMYCVLILLFAALTWSPQWSPGVGAGGCPAQCYWEVIDARNVFSDFWFFVSPSGGAAIGLLQTVFVVWGYAICLTYMVPLYFCISKAVFWLLPDAVFGFLGSILDKLCCRPLLHCLNTGQRTRLIGISKAVAEIIRILWWHLCFPSPLFALFFQIASWCFGFITLVIYRQESHVAIADSMAEDQWGFGQLFAVFLVGVPLLTLLETWSGKSLHATLVLSLQEVWR